MNAEKTDETVKGEHAYSVTMSYIRIANSKRPRGSRGLQHATQDELLSVHGQEEQRFLPKSELDESSRFAPNVFYA